MTRASVLLTLLLILVSCKPQLGLPEGIQLRCDTDADCPEPLKCGSKNLCFEGIEVREANAPPSLTIGAIPRTTGPVTIPVTVVDRESATVAIRARINTDGTFVDTTIVGEPIAATPEGVAAELTWTPGPGFPSDYRNDLAIELVPSDGEDDGPAVSATFAYGNTAPELLEVVVDTGSNGDVSDFTVVRFRVRDNSDDPVRVTAMEIHAGGISVPDPLTVGVGGSIPSGALSDLSTIDPDPTDGEAGAWQSFTWDTTVAAGFGVDGATLTLVVSDGLDSLPQTSQPFGIRNNARPTILSIDIPESAFNRPSGPVDVVYEVADAEGDVVDIDLDYSSDGGLSWNDCLELVIPRSEGTRDIAAPAAGMSHRFVWDASGMQRVATTRLRLRVADGVTHTDPTPVAIEMPIPGSIGADGLPVGFVDEEMASPNGEAITLGDFNGDGGVDVLTLAFDRTATGRIGNVGAPGFTPSTFAVDVAPEQLSAVAHCDLNNNGTVDFVGADRNNPLIHLFLHDGSLNVTLEGSYPIPNAATAVACADLDGDGLDDVVAGLNGNQVGIVRTLPGGGVADPDLAAAVTYAVPSLPTRVAVADLNGDGVGDVVASGGHSISVLFGQGILGSPTGTLSAAVGVEVGQPADAIRDLALADLNGDGASDVVVVLDNSAELVVYRATKDTSAPLALVDILAVDERSVTVAAGDFNGDGILDLVSASENTSAAAVLLGLEIGGRGTLEFLDLLRLPLPLEPRMIRAADGDADGVADLYVAGISSGGVANSGTVGLWSEGISNRGSLAERATSFSGQQEDIDTFDFNGDGLLDVVTVTNRNTVSFSLARADGTYPQPTELPLQGPPARLAVGDFDGDGIADVAATVGVPQIEVWLGGGSQGIGDGAFAAVSARTALTAAASELTVGQFNDDGYDDLALSVPAAGEVWILLSQGDGTFDTSRRHTIAGAPGDVTAGDLNGDGRTDLVVAQPSGSNAWVLLSTDTAGGFGVPTGAGVASGAQSLLLADVAGDAALDLVAVGDDGDIYTTFLSGSSVSIGDGTGGFAAPVEQILDTASHIFSPTDCEVADMNGDGHLDLIVNNAGMGQVEVFAGNSLGTWGPPFGVRVSGNNNTPRRIAVADINGDGLPDLVSGNRYSSISIITGQSTTRTQVRGLTASSADAAALSIGADLVEGTNRLGMVIAGPRVTLHRAQIEIGDRTTDFMAELRKAVPTAAGERLTDPWRLGVDRRWANVSDGTTGSRLRSENRLGPRTNPGSRDDFDRTGLELAQGRGVQIELQTLRRFTAAQIAAGTVKVYVRTTEVATAADVPADPRNGDGDAVRFLPVVPDGSGGFRPLLQRSHLWSELPEVADLNGVASDSFLVDGVVVRIRSATPGIYLATLE